MLSDLLLGSSGCPMAGPGASSGERPAGVADCGGHGARAARCGSGRAEQVFRAVAVVGSATRAAAVVHMIHGESNAVKTVLLQFQNALREQGLDNGAGITSLDSSARADRKPRFTRILSFHAGRSRFAGWS